MTDYGTDLACMDDLPADLGTATGQTQLGQALARRLMTPRGTLLTDQTYGYDLRSKLGSTVALTMVEREIVHECSQDERVDNVTAKVLATDDNGIEKPLSQATRLGVRLAVQAASGTFDFVLSVDSVSATVLAT